MKRKKTRKNRWRELVVDLLRDKKLESAGVISYVSYAGVKIVFRSFPTAEEFFLLVFFVVVVRFCKLASRSDFIKIIKEWLSSIDAVWARTCGRQLFPACEPNQLIYWLSAGKFNPNIACAEKVPFLDPDIQCRRIACRFSHEIEKIPKIMRMRWPARLFVGDVFISEHLNTMKRRQLGPPGDLLGYNVFGITFEIDEKHWAEVVQEYSSRKKNDSEAVVRLVAHIARFTGRVRIAVEARKIRSRLGVAIIYGKYVNGFNPRTFRTDPNRCISLPVCDALQRQYCPSSEWRKYSPAIPIS